MGLYINLVQIAMYYAKNTDKVEDSSKSIMLDSVYDESVLAQYVEREIENNSLFSNFEIKYNMDPLFKQNWNYVLLAFQNLKLSKDVCVVDAKAREKADIDLLEPYANTGLKIKANTYAVRITSFTCAMLWLPNLLVIKNDRELRVYTYNMLDFSFLTTRIEKRKTVQNFSVVQMSGPYMRLEIQTPIDNHARGVADSISNYKGTFPVNVSKKEEEIDIIEYAVNADYERTIERGQNYAGSIKSMGFEVGLVEGQHIDNYLIYLFKSTSKIKDDLKQIEELFNEKLGDSFLFKEVADDEFLVYEEVRSRALESTVIKRVLDDAIERSQKLDMHKKAKENMGKVKDSTFDTSFVPITQKENVAKTTKKDKKDKKAQANMENFKAVTAKEEDENSLEHIFDELGSLTGLESVKEELKELVYVVQNRQKREAKGLKVPPISLHLVFTGNPGTGKTTVARYVAQIYKALGLLSEGQMIETDRSGLVAGYMGQTAIKTKEIIETALGGVLFIDEAYALTNKTEGDFGIEAVDTLLKAMEDNRDNLVVIVAGYDDLMEEFIEANPGLKSRFNRYIHFDDYKPEEMFEIFENMCKKYQYTISDDAKDVILSHFSNIESSEIGNGRGVRNIFEKVITEQAKRLETGDNVDADLQTIHAADFINAVKL